MGLLRRVAPRNDTQVGSDGASPSSHQVTLTHILNLLKALRQQGIMGVGVRR